MTRQTTRQADQRARQSHKRAKSARARKASPNYRPRSEMTKAELGPWFERGWGKLLGWLRVAA